MAYIGTVDVFSPVPNPVITRPIIKCGTEKAVVWRMAPTMTNPIATQIVLRRPSNSPKKKFTTQGYMSANVMTYTLKSSSLTDAAGETS